MEDPSKIKERREKEVFEKQHEEFIKLLRNFNKGMLATISVDGKIHSQPVYIAEANFDDFIWLIACIDTSFITELQVCNSINLSMQSGYRIVSISGKAEIVRDENKIDELWSISSFKVWQQWFPQGRIDPSVCLIHVITEKAEYWDYSGMYGIKVAFQKAKAIITGQRFEDNPGVDIKIHGQVDVAHQKAEFNK